MQYDGGATTEARRPDGKGEVIMLVPSRGLLAAGAAVAILGVAPQASATSTDVVLNVEGNPTCSSLVNNQQITELRINTVPNDGGPFTAVQGSQTIEYFIDENKTSLDWTSDLDDPVNFVILQGSGSTGGIVYHFGRNGATSDFEEFGPADRSGNPSTITKIAFCYGLEGGTVSTPTKLPSCALNDNFDGTGVTCPNDNSKRVLFSFDPESEDFAVTACTCNLSVVECDPDNPEADNSCLTDEQGEFKELTEVPVLVEATKNPGTYYCIIIGGRRTCYSD